MTVIGFGGANCQMAAFALPELLYVQLPIIISLEALVDFLFLRCSPNKWRHLGVVMADAVIYLTVIVAPVTARYGYQFGTWEWNFWSMAIFQFLSFLGLFFLYFPPAHP